MAVKSCFDAVYHVNIERIVGNRIVVCQSNSKRKYWDVVDGLHPNVKEALDHGRIVVQIDALALSALGAFEEESTQEL
jgi:hypothetical protein